jgi:hypothetical protein
MPDCSMLRATTSIPSSRPSSGRSRKRYKRGVETLPATINSKPYNEVECMSLQGHRIVRV